MIGLDDYDSEQQPTSELPEKPLKEWRLKYEAGSLLAPNLMQYFSAASPFFFTIDQTAEYSDLGKWKKGAIAHFEPNLRKGNAWRAAIFTKNGDKNNTLTRQNVSNNNKIIERAHFDAFGRLLEYVRMEIIHTQ